MSAHNCARHATCIQLLSSPSCMLRDALFTIAVFGLTIATSAAPRMVEVQSPNGRNLILLQAADDNDGQVRFSVKRDGKLVIRPSTLGPVLTQGGRLAKGSGIADVRHSEIDESFQFRWGKASTVVNRCSFAVITLVTPTNLRWELQLRAYDDGVAFRYRLPQQDALNDFEIRDEQTQFDVAGDPVALFNGLASFTTSHESLYERKSLSALPVRQLIDMPLLLVWPDGRGAAITEARVRDFAGAYLERTSVKSSALRCRLSPLPSRKDVCVAAQTPHESPWRVVLFADVAGKLLESNLLLCLNDPQLDRFDWLVPGKTTWHWWYGAFEDDHKLPQGSAAHFERHKKYIDFCARNNITYHAVSGDGRSWYVQSENGYGNPAADADVLTPRPRIQLPKILQYAHQRGVGIRLWVHWKPLSQHLEEAFTLYESWGIKGLMVDFLNRDDQEMIEFTERMLLSAARHKLHIQIHGSSKNSGEQRTFPHLFNREGVLNLEFLKWGDRCTPDHNVNVAYTRALAGPVDYHLGGFRSVSRAEFQPRNLAPEVLGTRCHHMALYVVYENPMPMIADSPHSYHGQSGFDFIMEVPTVWDETRFVTGIPGEYVVVARRKADKWYAGGITNWNSRELEIPLDFLGPGRFEARLYVDGSLDETRPNAINHHKLRVDAETSLKVSLAPGGGFTAAIRTVEGPAP